MFSWAKDICQITIAGDFRCKQVETSFIWMFQGRTLAQQNVSTEIYVIFVRVTFFSFGYILVHSEKIIGPFKIVMEIEGEASTVLECFGDPKSNKETAA